MSKPLDELVREYFKITGEMEQRLRRPSRLLADSRLIDRAAEVTNEMRRAVGLDHEQNCIQCGTRKVYCEGGCRENQDHLCDVCWPDPLEIVDRKYDEQRDMEMIHGAI